MKKGTCQIKIVDDFPIARIYIDGVEVRGIRKFEVKRSVGKIAIVKLEFIPTLLDMDLTEIGVRGFTYYRYKIFNFFNDKFYAIKEKFSSKDEN